MESSGGGAGPTNHDAIEPAIMDCGGYRIRRRDLEFLHISDAAVRAWQVRAAPLGLSLKQYEGLRRELLRSLGRDGVPLSECTVRLKGSAAEFFAGIHKQLPRSRAEIGTLFKEIRNRTPKDWEIDDIVERFHGTWIRDGNFPTQRPFDSMHRIGLAREPSDIDLQISSDVLVQRCEQELAEAGLPATRDDLFDRRYGFVDKRILINAAESLYLFSLRMTDALQRHVSIAIFPSSGPDDTTKVGIGLSSHHRDTDWMIPLQIGAEAEAAK